MTIKWYSRRDHEFERSVVMDAISDICDHLGGRYEVFSSHCDSPIECKLITTFDFLARMTFRNFQFTTQETFYEDIKRHQVVAISQFNWRKYRIDFCFSGLVSDGHLLFVECDGHDFHERTKEQAARDRKKDRDAQIAGIPILRFTGSQIHSDPVGCCNEIANAILTLKRRIA